MAKSSIRKRAQAAVNRDIDSAIVDALAAAINQTPKKSTIMEKLRLGAESDDDFRRWLVLLFEPDLVSPFSSQSAKKSTKKKTPSFDVLVAATRQAIDKATEVDHNRINHNFDYDYQAYEEVHHNLIKLIEHERARLSYGVGY